MIFKARLASNQEPLERGGSLEQATIGVWAEALQDIPLEHLNRCYLAALKKHSSSFPLCVGEIAAVWVEEETSMREAKPVEDIRHDHAEVCEECNGLRFQLVAGKGAKPCPKCNVQQAAKW